MATSRPLYLQLRRAPRELLDVAAAAATATAAATAAAAVAAATGCTTSSSSHPDHKVRDVLDIFRMTVFRERSSEPSHLSEPGEKPKKNQRFFLGMCMIKVQCVNLKGDFPKR
jgi:hypothetical protein